MNFFKDTNFNRTYARHLNRHLKSFFLPERRALAEAEIARQRAQEAHIATLAKPAEMARTRGNDGVLLTLAKESYAIMVDRSLLDMAKLAPFFTDPEVEKALRAWRRKILEQQVNLEFDTAMQIARKTAR